MAALAPFIAGVRRQFPVDFWRWQASTLRYRVELLLFANQRDPAEWVSGSLAFVAVPRLVKATTKPQEVGHSLRLVGASFESTPAIHV